MHLPAARADKSEIAAFSRASSVKKRGLEVEREVITPKKTWAEQSITETLDIGMCLTSRNVNGTSAGATGYIVAISKHLYNLAFPHLDVPASYFGFT
jgi:hypothetical protein